MSSSKIDMHRVRELMPVWSTSEMQLQMWFAINEYESENAYWDDYTGNRILQTTFLDWISRMALYQANHLWSLLDEALADRYDGTPANDVWDSASIAFDAYETWFLKQYQSIVKGLEAKDA